jgi:hypothetical protein
MNLSLGRHGPTAGAALGGQYPLTLDTGLIQNTNELEGKL